MKIHHVVSMFALLTLGSSALAQSSGAGQVEGILDYCVKVAPNLAPQAAAFKWALSQDAPHSNVSANLALREFRPYVGSYEAVQLALSKLPKSQVISACTNTLGATGTQGKSRER